MEIIELDENGEVLFTPMTNTYGRAEFDICTKWEEVEVDNWVDDGEHDYELAGKKKVTRLTEVFIVPRQQPDKGNVEYHIKGIQAEAIICRTLDSAIKEDPNIWKHWWCNEHKCMSFSMYVPIKTNFFRVVGGSYLWLDFGRKLR